jgi:hypothetical protein
VKLCGSLVASLYNYTKHAYRIITNMQEVKAK